VLPPLFHNINAITIFNLGAPRIGLHLSGPGYPLYAPHSMPVHHDITCAGRMPLLSVAHYLDVRLQKVFSKSKIYNRLLRTALPPFLTVYLSDAASE